MAKAGVPGQTHRTAAQWQRTGARDDRQSQHFAYLGGRGLHLEEGNCQN